MSAHKNIDRICIAVTVLTLVIAFIFCNGQALGVKSTAHAIGYENRLFDHSRVHTIDIVMNDWDGFIEGCESEEYSACNLVIDGEAGIEQINRRVLEKVTHLICVSDQSRKGLSIIETIRNVADELVMYNVIGLIVNRAPLPEKITEKEIGGVRVISVIPQDDAMTENDIEGKSIFAHDGRGKVAAAYENLTMEVLNGGKQIRKHLPA